MALLQSSCGNDTKLSDSTQLSSPGCRWDELYLDLLIYLFLIVTCCTGHGRGAQVCIEASNEPCIHKSASDVACRDSARTLALLGSSCENERQLWDSMQVSKPGCRCDELYPGRDQTFLIVTCCTGHGRLHWAWEIA